jgi:hypothetical protein
MKSVSPLTQEEIESWTKFQFYLTDGDIEFRLEEWNDYLVARDCNYRFTIGSSSYSGFRFITFLFEQEQEAALFRLFVGDGGKRYELKP